MLNEKALHNLHKRMPVAFFLLRFFYRRLLAFMYIKNMLTDPGSLRKYALLYLNVKKTQLNHNVLLFRDRKQELKEFFSVSDAQLCSYFFRNGLPTTRMFKNRLMRFFERQPSDDANLKESYEKAAFHYSLRLMLGYERYSLILPYISYIRNNSSNNFSGYSILDYGCGVADIGLLFATMGSKVTIADLNDKKLEFAAWRFKKRRLSPKVIVINNPSRYPSLPQREYDLIIATEVLEHVRNPLMLLQRFIYALKDGGLLFNTIGKNFKKEDAADHLDEAFEIGRSKEYQELFARNFKGVDIVNCNEYLFQKIG